MAPAQRILTVCQGWDSGLGGVSTVNREISLALAELGHTVTARIAQPSQPHPQVQLAIAPPVIGIDDDRAWLLHPAGLPTATDVIIGHSRFSGGAAAVLRDAFYPNARMIHFLHTSPELLGRLQQHPDAADRNARNERALITGAELVVGVGPLIAEEARRLARQAREQPPPVHELIPGIVHHDRPQYSSEPVRRFHMLLFGRANEPLKGARNAAEITRALRERGWDVQLTVRGAVPAEQQAQEQELSTLAGSPVWVKPFTADPNELQQDLRGADLVLVAAEHEDFGLVATEAAGTGIPMLVGSHTGVGMFLSDPARVPARLAMSSVVPDTSRNAPLWAERVEAVIRDIGPERQRAAELQQHLTTTYTWTAAADNMINALHAQQDTRTHEKAPVVLARAHSHTATDTSKVGEPGQTTTQERGAAAKLAGGYPGVDAARPISAPPASGRANQPRRQRERGIEPER